MKRLIQLFYKYPDTDINQDGIVLSQPIYNRYTGYTTVKVQSKLKDKGYIDTNVIYRQYDLDWISKEKDYTIEIDQEETVYEILDKLNLITNFNSTIYTDGNPQIIKHELLEEDIENQILPLLEENEVKEFIIKTKDTSYLFRGHLTVSLKKKHKKIDFPTSIDFKYQIKLRNEY